MAFQIFASAWLAVIAGSTARAGEESPAAAAARRYVEALTPFGFRGAVVSELGGAEELALGNGEIAVGGAPITPDTIFDLGSNSKCYTAAAALLLVDRGEWALDDALPVLLGAGAGTEKRAEKGADGLVVPPDKRAITLRQLLSHSAGLDHSGHFASDFEVVARDEAIRRILARPLLFAPGRDSSYSDAGYILTAALIERRTGRPFMEFMAEELFAPLGLERTGFWGPDPRLAALPDAAFAGGRIDGVERGSGRQFGAPTFAILGAGGMVASVRDVAAFLRAVRSGELLGDELATAYESAQFRLGPQQAEGFGFVIATVGARTVRQSAGGTPELGHNAMLSWSQPDDRLLVIHTADAGWRGEDLAPRLRALLEGRSLPAPPELAPRDDAALARAAGRFVLAGGGTIELAVARGALDLRSLDGDGFAALHGSAAGDAAAAHAGLDRVFQKRVDPGIEAWRARRGAEFGREQSVVLLGHATIDGGSEPWSFVRVDFERGSANCRFVFGPRGSIEALVLDTALPTIRLWPLRDGSFAPFSLGPPPALLAVRLAHGETGRAGELALDFGAGRTVAAKRAG